jgi:hypothetical protein
MTNDDATVDEQGRCVLSELLPDQCACRLHAAARPKSGRGHTGPPVHQWRRDDDMVVAAAYLEYGTNNLPADAKARLAELIGCSVASVAYKLGNLHSYVAGQGALDQGSAQMRSVVDQLREASSMDREHLANEAYQRLRR